MSELKSKKIYDVLEFRYKDDHRTGPGPNEHHSAGDDYGDQFKYSVKTAREMLLFIKLKVKILNMM